MIAFRQFLQEDGGTDIVDRGVMLDLIHALADADRSRQMRHHVDPGKCLAELVAITNIAGDQLGLGIQISRSFAVLVDLRVETIENPHPVSGAQKLSGEVRPDETGAPDDQYRL